MYIMKNIAQPKYQRKFILNTFPFQKIPLSTLFIDTIARLECSLDFCDSFKFHETSNDVGLIIYKLQQTIYDLHPRNVQDHKNGQIEIQKCNHLYIHHTYFKTHFHSHVFSFRRVLMNKTFYVICF